jgi:hypothetical protein
MGPSATECFSVPTAPSQAFYSQYCDPSYSYPTCINLRGNAGRNILTGPGLVNLDYSLVKNNHLTEALNLQFRAEFFNILNHTNFQVPPLDTGTDIFESNTTLNHCRLAHVHDYKFATDSARSQADLVRRERGGVQGRIVLLRPACRFL